MAKRMNTAVRRERAQAIIRGTSDEPTIKPTTRRYQFDMVGALNWYNVNAEEKDLRQYADQYVKNHDMAEYRYAISKASLQEIRHIGMLGRLLSRGQHVSVEHMEYFFKCLDSVKAAYIKPTNAPKSTNVVSIQDRITDAAREAAGEIEFQIDEFVRTKRSDFVVRDYLEANNISSAVAKRIGDFYKPLAKELAEAVAGKDEQLVEGYGRFKKTQLKRFAQFVQSIVDGCAQKAVAVVRKARVKKAKPASQVVAKMKYLKEFEPLKLKSINPAAIVGASEVWFYSPIKRKLTVFRATAGALGVKGTTITNYDVLTSEVKTVRKPEEFFKGLNTSSKRAMAAAWKGLAAKVSKPRSRVNDEMLILSVN